LLWLWLSWQRLSLHIKFLFLSQRIGYIYWLFLWKFSQLIFVSLLSDMIHGLNWTIFTTMNFIEHQNWCSKNGLQKKDIIIMKLIVISPLDSHHVFVHHPFFFCFLNIRIPFSKYSNSLEIFEYLFWNFQLFEYISDKRLQVPNIRIRIRIFSWILNIRICIRLLFWSNRSNSGFFTKFSFQKP
jgi:hypothetical protein